MFLIDGYSYTTSDSDFVEALSSAYKKGIHPFCQCKNPPVEMYIAQINSHYYIKRMPDSGGKHAISCNSYEPPSEVSGKSYLLGKSIVIDPEKDMTMLKLDFSITKGAARGQIEPTGIEHGSVKTQSNKMDLGSLLHYFWDEAGLNRWHTNMRGKRNWYFVQRELNRVFVSSTTRNRSMGEICYAPETFRLEYKDQIELRRKKRFFSYFSADQYRSKMICIGKLTALDPGWNRLTMKHMPGFSFNLDERDMKRVLNRFSSEIQIAEADHTVNLIAAVLFGMAPNGVTFVEEVALMTTDEDWLPFEDMTDFGMLHDLKQQRRSFIRCMRYNVQRTTPMASFLMTDLEEPTAMFISPPSASEDFRTAMNQVIEESHMPTWYWDTTATVMPPLPGMPDEAVPQREAKQQAMHQTEPQREAKQQVTHLALSQGDSAKEATHQQAEPHREASHEAVEHETTNWEEANWEAGAQIAGQHDYLAGWSEPAKQESMFEAGQEFSHQGAHLAEHEGVAKHEERKQPSAPTPDKNQDLDWTDDADVF